MNMIESNGRRVRLVPDLRQMLGPVLGLVLVIVIFGIIAPQSFLSVYNFKVVAAQSVIVGLGAIGMTFVITSGGIDLSVGSVIALASVLTALMMQQFDSPVVAIALGVGIGAVCGAVNGLVITGLRIVPFIATLGMFGIARGIAKYLAGEQKIDAPAGWIPELMAKEPSASWILVAPGVWITIVLGILMAILLNRTTFGTNTFAIGSNESTARLCGIQVRRTKILIYMLCGIFAGLAGVMQFGRLTVGDPTTALGKELDIIAAVVIGGASLAGGEGRISGALVGAVLMAFLANGCTHAGVPNYVQEIIIGIIIIAAVALDSYRHSGSR